MDPSQLAQLPGWMQSRDSACFGSNNWTQAKWPEGLILLKIHNIDIVSKCFSQLPVRPTCDCVARSSYLRLRSHGENQHSAAFACGMNLSSERRRLNARKYRTYIADNSIVQKSMHGAIARSTYLRLRSHGENQHSAAFACGMFLLSSAAV